MKQRYLMNSSYPLWFLGAFLLSPTSFGVGITPYEDAVVVQLNKVRANPKSLIPALQELYRRMDGKFLFLSPTLRIQTQEGATPITEAIAALQKTKPVPEFQYSALLSQAARDHAKEQSTSGATGHFSAGGAGPSERAKKYVVLKGKSGENVSYGEYGGNGPQSVVMAFVVDDGVPDRGHRRNFFDPDFLLVGIGCGPHAKYESMCVVDFAHDVRKK